MSVQMPTAGTLPRLGSSQRIALPQWTTQAWGAIGIATLFIGITCWWLTQDRSIPVYDAGRHLSFAFYVFEYLRSGDIGRALTRSYPYPPLTYLVGDLGILFGGINVAPPIIAENLVFVPLLTLGCYRVGRIAFGRTAGFLAVVFALGSPLITAQFHVFMTDAPETAMVAVSLWAVLATDGFCRVATSAGAGVAVGLGLLIKEPFAFFIVGPVAVTAIRGGPKAWRGLIAFTVVALVIAMPWYLYELTRLSSLSVAAISEAGTSQPTGIAPPRFSAENLEWYFWNIVNSQLYLPLFAFSAVGWVWMMVGFVRRRPVTRFALELAIGTFVAWLAITETFVRDTRYSMPLLVYLAVFGVGWISRLPRTKMVVAAVTLTLACIANVAATSVGLGRPLRLSLPEANAGLMQRPGQLTIYSNEGFWVAGPKWDGDMLATLKALRHNGIRTVAVAWATQYDQQFSQPGLFALTQIVGLKTILGDHVLVEGAALGAYVPAQRLTNQDAVLENYVIQPGNPPPCVQLDNGTGVWIRLGDPDVPHPRFYCPSREPRFYG
ncbi:MAG TPA: glycosyltransferase family 39 protein [Solirubrobacteraceae bacterium]|nr:glycosyltransferase family 39 protein [Solirubrobacteraceae bacterium]